MINLLKDSGVACDGRSLDRPRRGIYPSCNTVGASFNLQDQADEEITGRAI
jgi:hypothetical protein